MNFYHGDRYIIKFNETDGKYWKYLEKNYKKVVFNGDENIYYSNLQIENTILLQYHLDTKKNTKPLSNYFSYNQNNWNSGIESISLQENYAGDTILQIVIKIDRLSSPNEDGFKTWLSTHNTEVIYKVKTPELIPIEPVDIMNMTYYPTTNCFTSIDNIFLKVKYYRDFVNTIKNMQIDNNTLKNQLQDIEKRLSAVESKPTIEPEPQVEEVISNA